MVFKCKKTAREIKDRLEEFLRTVSMAAVKQHLHFTAEIWTEGVNSPTHEKEDRVQFVMNDEFPCLDTKISWSPEGDLQFGVFSKKGQQLKYVGKESTHTPGTLRAIPSGVLNRLAKLTSRNPSIQAEAVENIFTPPTRMLSARRA